MTMINKTLLLLAVFLVQVGCIRQYDDFHQGMDQSQGDAVVDVVHMDVTVADLDALDNPTPYDTDLFELSDTDVDEVADTLDDGDTGDSQDLPEVLPPVCGDSKCNGLETCTTCPLDCGCTVCGETCQSGTCTFTACDGLECGFDSNGCGENCGTCPSGQSWQFGQCGVHCGDGQCDTSETQCSCPTDCGTCAGCCAGTVCEAGTLNTECGKNGEICTSCGTGESCQSQVCGVYCGDGVCVAGEEDCSTCPGDCGCDCGEECLNGRDPQKLIRRYFTCPNNRRPRSSWTRTLEPDRCTMHCRGPDETERQG